MEFLINEIDMDSLIKTLEDSKDAYKGIKIKISTHEHNKYMLYLLYNLLRNPDTQLIDNLLATTQDNLLFFIDTLKRIVKSKFLYLNCQENIIQIVNNLDKIVGDKEILDTLIINCLRYEAYSDSVQKLDTQSAFQSYLKGIDENSMFNIFGKDFVFSRTFDKMLHNENEFSQYCNFPTQKQFLVARISPILEFNLLFYIEQVHSHYETYEDWIFRYYIIDVEIAKNVLRYLVAVYFTKNTKNLTRLIYVIFMKYECEYIFVSIFYDAFLYCSVEPVNLFLVTLILEDMNNSRLFIKYFGKFLTEKTIRKRFVSFLKASKLNYSQIIEYYRLNEVTIGSIVYTLEIMDFDSYYQIIRTIEQTRKPFIKFEMYDELIDLSSEWDGYMQVFLWKIFMHQRIHFGFTPEKYKVRTCEGKDGYELLKHLK